MSGNSYNERIIWVDLEMTGLDLEKDRIIEMACIVTDKNLNIIAKGPNLIINQPDSLLDSMNDWCKKHHGQSGLTDAVKKSDITQLEAEKMMLAFVEQHTLKSTCPLAGNSIHTDKMFLEKYMPDFIKHLHYRIIDVSSIKELCRRWYPHVFSKAPSKALSHRAEDDIQESIEELKYYRKTIFMQE